MSCCVRGAIVGTLLTLSSFPTPLLSHACLTTTTTTYGSQQWQWPWQRNEGAGQGDKGRGLRHDTSQAPGMFFFLFLFYFTNNYLQVVQVAAATYNSPCYCLSPLPWPRWPHAAPTSHYDSLVLFLLSPLTTVATHSTNKSLRLVGAFSSFSLDNASHTHITEISSRHTATTTLLTHRASHATTHKSISLVVFLFHYFNSIHHC